MTQSGIELVILRLVAQCPNQPRHRVPPANLTDDVNGIKSPKSWIFINATDRTFTLIIVIRHWAPLHWLQKGCNIRCCESSHNTEHTIPEVYKLSKNPRATSEFWVSQRWHDANSLLRTYKHWVPPCKMLLSRRPGAQHLFIPALRNTAVFSLYLHIVIHS